MVGEYRPIFCIQYCNCTVTPNNIHTSAEACEKSSRWLWKEKLCKHWCEKARKHICFTDLHDMTLAVKSGVKPQ